MEIRHLIYFVEVAHRRNFSAAAEALFLTQPTISKMIRNLEDELGVALFNRVAKKVELTDAGRAILKPSQDIIRAFQNLGAELEDVTHLRKGSIRIGMPPMIGVSYFSRIIGEFNKIYPNVSTQLIEVGSRSVEQGLLDGDLDLGIVLLPLDDARFNVFEFVRESVVAIVGPDHPLHKNRFAKLQDFSLDQFIMLRKDFALHDQVIEQCKKLGFTPQIACQTSQWDFIISMVAENLGVGFLPRKVLELNVKKQVHMLMLKDTPLLWNLAVVWEKDRHLSYAARSWLEFAQNALRGTMSVNNRSTEHER